jgi:uncharacterized protein (TIGR02246 family)
MNDRHRVRTYCGAILLTAMSAISAFAQQDDPKPPRVGSDRERQAIPPTSHGGADKKTESPSASSTGPQAESPQVQAIRATGKRFVKEFNEADAKGIAEHFSAEAEYIDVDGNSYEGREEIEKAFESCFAVAPGLRLELLIDQIRLISPTVAIEDGRTIVIPAMGNDAVQTRYSAVHIKQNDEWLVASVRERELSRSQSQRYHLEQLSWLQGDWVDESDGSVVIFHCESLDRGNFLLRKFSIHIAGEPALSGEQRIGWDPLTHKLRTWIFDSEGGYGDGFWFRRGDAWFLKTVGVTGSGEPASSTSIYLPVDENTMRWQSIDHEIGGVPIPDSDPITIVRKSPFPEVKNDGDANVTSRNETK